MTVRELNETSKPDVPRTQACVLLAAGDGDAETRRCLQSLLEHTAASVPLVVLTPDAHEVLPMLEELGAAERRIWLAAPAPASAGAQTHGVASTGTERPGSVALTTVADRALALLAPADAALLTAPCLLPEGWLERLRAAARADSNTATASAFALAGSALALRDADSQSDAGAESGNPRPGGIHPRLDRAVGPCVYLRREALELVGGLDRSLELDPAVSIDHAQRCVLVGLSHVAADEVLVEQLVRATAEVPEVLRERYPFLPRSLPREAPLRRAIELARGEDARLWVTIDARALVGRITGTQRHIVELIRWLGATDRLRLRLLIAHDIDTETRELLGSLPHTELLAAASVDASTPRSTIFHRPQQVFKPEDLRVALRLGERVVINQLDLIAYRNPGYHTDPAAWHSHRRVTREALAVAERIIVFSEHTRMELLSDELVAEERTLVIPPGLDHPLDGDARAPAALAPDADGERFLLCLGTDFRHKNRPFAMRLLAALRERHGWHGRLVLAGTHIPDGSSAAAEQALLEREPHLREAIIDLGPVDEAEKTWLMRHAAAVVYPSVYEGFGLVPFEAALSGVPCLFASQSALAAVLPAEVAAIVPWDPLLSAQRSAPLLQDETARDQHIATIRQAAARLTWRDSAAATLRAYHEAAAARLPEAQALSRDELEREHEVRQLVAAQDALVADLVGEREHARGMYDELNARVGSGLSLIGPQGSLPEDAQRALLSISAHPALSRPLFGAGALVFRIMRRLARLIRGLGSAGR